MNLTFVYAPVADLEPALVFYRDVLGLEEAWREGDETVVFQLPDSSAQLMVSLDPEGRSGPIYLVDDVREFLAARADLVAEPVDIPDGTMATFEDPAGNAVHILDQKGAAVG